MPEGPEIRRFADDLSQKLVGQYVISAVALATGRYAATNPIGFNDFAKDLKDVSPCRVDRVNTRGKFMYWAMSFSDETTWYLWITHGMYATWTPNMTSHSAFVIDYTSTRPPEPPLSYDHHGLYFNDKRHYGTLKFCKSTQEMNAKLDSLGPDMLVDPPDLAHFTLCLTKRKKKTLAEALMDQSVISGVGNYVKAESLYAAKLSPHRIIASLTLKEFENLYRAIVDVMCASYKSGGWLINAYHGDGRPTEGWQQRFAVYNNILDPLGNEVVSEKTKDGRTSWWVPSVQK